MIFDEKLLFCDDAAMVADAAVGDIVDLNDAGLDLAVGEIPFFGIMVTEALAGTTTTMNFVFSSCDTVGGSYTTLFTSEAYAKAAIIPGKKIKVPIPDGCQQFVKIATLSSGSGTGTVTAGKMTAGIVK